MINLRPYQLDSIEQLREGIRNGHKRQILYLPTGAGKTVIATHLMQEADAKMSRAVFIVDRVALVNQTSAMFDQYKVSHGVLQADHWRWRTWERIQVASIQTLQRRGFPEKLQLGIVDECHTAFKATIDFMNAHPEMVFIGLTATPFSKGLGRIYSNIVNVTTTDHLIADGFLAPIKAYAAKKIDLEGAKLKSDGEWNDADVNSRAMVIVGDVVQSWIEKTIQHFNGPVKTLVFSASVAHGAELCKKFQAAGFNFQQISYKDTNDEQRAALIEEFRKDNSDIVGLISCEVLAKGFDVPDVLCGVSCRPYRKSLSGHIQQLGRVMRPYPGKEFGLWIDHAGNFLRFAEDTKEIFSDGIHDLNDKELDSKIRKEPEDKDYSSKCSHCGYVLVKTDLICPSCGTPRPRRQSTTVNVAGELHEIDMKKKEPAWLADRDLVWRQLAHEGLNRKDGDMIPALKWARAQYHNIYKQWPEGTLAVPYAPISFELDRKVRDNLRKYFKNLNKVVA